MTLLAYLAVLEGLYGPVHMVAEPGGYEASYSRASFWFAYVYYCPSRGSQFSPRTGTTRRNRHQGKLVGRVRGKRG